MRQNTAPQMTGADLIAAERLRQVEVEGWTAEHDEKLGAPVLEAAAVSYEACGEEPEPPAYWPWARQSWKPNEGHLRNLVRAGALFQAAGDVADGVHAVRQLGQRDLVAALIDAALAAAISSVATPPPAESTEPESMRWQQDRQRIFTLEEHGRAICDWINANGGEARYVPPAGIPAPGWPIAGYPYIAIRPQVGRWLMAVAGETVTMTDR